MAAATGQHTKEQLLKRVWTWGLTNRRGKPLTSQAIAMLLLNQLYAGIVDVPEYGVCAKRGDFEPLISEDLFYRVQAIRSGACRTRRPAPVRIWIPVAGLRPLSLVRAWTHRQLVEGAVRAVAA